MAIELITLTEPSTGVAAKILAGFGFNCFSFRTTHNGRPIEALWAAPHFESGNERPSGSGIPILFPFPGRIQGTMFEWEGKQYPLHAGDGRGNAIHGFVHERAWRVVEQSESRVVGQFQASLDDPTILKSWPADFRITADYQVQGNSLKTIYLIENPDERPLPCGLGTHPYFRVPLGGDIADECIVKLPVNAKWELVDMNATGKRLPLDDAEKYQSGLRFGEMIFDNVLTGLQFDGDACTASVHDPASSHTLEMTFDRAFRECVVYNPPHREAVCIEPYTSVPDAFRLTKQGVDAGQRVLQPGESFRATVEMRVA